MRGQTAVLNARAVYSVSGEAARKLPPIPRKRRIAPSCIALIVFHRIHAMSSRRGKTKFSPSFSRNCSLIRSQMPTCDRPAHWNDRESDMAPPPAGRYFRRGEGIHHFLNGRDGILVLGQSHRPAANDAFAAHRDFGGGADLLTGQAAAFDDIVPGRRSQILDELGKPIVYCSMNSRSKIVPGRAIFLRQHLLHDATHRSHVAVNTHR